MSFYRKLLVVSFLVAAGCTSPSQLEENNVAICGDGILAATETCDDGNNETEMCEYGSISGCVVCAWDCTEVFGETQFCGDGEVSEGEECDDRNGRTDTCEYGENSCTVCNADCQWGPGAASYCGDGVTSHQEICDGDCPSTCDDNNECTSNILLGDPNDCDAFCNFDPIVFCRDDDGCCPSGCGYAEDNDCLPNDSGESGENGPLEEENNGEGETSEEETEPGSGD